MNRENLSQTSSSSPPFPHKDVAFETLWKSNNQEIQELAKRVNGMVDVCYDDFLREVFDGIQLQVLETITNETQKELLMEFDNTFQILDEIVFMVIDKKTNHVPYKNDWQRVFRDTTTNLIIKDKT